MKKIKTLMTVLCATLLVMGMVSSASALLITPETVPVLFGDETSNAAIEAYIVSMIPAFNPDQLYEIAAGDVSNFTVTQNLIVSDPLWLLVKDGSALPAGVPPPAWYLFNLNGWNGTEDIVLQNFWPAQGGISHVSIYGDGVSVPEPLTLLLLGFGLVGLAGVRRFRK